MRNKTQALLHRPRFMGLFGLFGCAVALLLSVFDTTASLTGWLVAFVFWSGLPIGALGIVMMMRLIPGVWIDQLSATAEAALFLTPIAALAALPVLLGLHDLYIWTGTTADSGLRGLYLTPWFFILRTGVFFFFSATIAFLLLTPGKHSVAVAASGIILFVILDTTIVQDWIMSLEPEFHSSGFGLYVLSIQMTVALTAIIILRLGSEPALERVSVVSAALLTALLLWAYLSFMQYFIIWSGNAPSSVIWYQYRSAGFWSIIEYGIALLHIGPMLLLFFPPIQRSRRFLMGLSLAVLLGKALEVAWLVIPSVKVDPILASGIALLAAASLCILSFPTIARAMQFVTLLRTPGGEIQKASP